MFSDFGTYVFLHHSQSCQVGALHCVQQAPLYRLSFISSYITGISTYIIQSGHTYSSTMQRSLTHIDTVVNEERNKVTVCLYMNTLMRRSVEVETNSCFIMFTCGWTLWSSLTLLEQMTQSWSCIFVCACVSDLMCIWCCFCIFMWLCGHLDVQAVCFR